MADKGRRVEPRIFFLNEHHELGPSKKPGRGGLPKYEAIPWAIKGQKILASLKTVERAFLASRELIAPC